VRDHPTSNLTYQLTQILQCSVTIDAAAGNDVSPEIDPLRWSLDSVKVNPTTAVDGNANKIWLGAWVADCKWSSK
jgi:hypothetical protein